MNTAPAAGLALSALPALQTGQSTPYLLVSYHQAGIPPYFMLAKASLAKVQLIALKRLLSNA